MAAGSNSSTHGLTEAEYNHLESVISTYHKSEVSPNTCTSLVTQRINAPAAVVWSFVRQFDRPQSYKKFIMSCTMHGDGNVQSLREVRIVSGLPASTSVERLEMLNEEKHILSFKVVGGEHRMNNYKSVTSVNEIKKNNNEVYTIVLESYIVDIPDGNTKEETKTVVETIVKMNLLNLANVSETSLH